MIKWFLISLAVYFGNADFYHKTEYRVGGTFSDIVHQVAFRVTINQLNQINSEESLELVPDNFNISYYNSLEVRRAVCTLLERGIVGLFGPSSSFTSNYIQSICDNKEIPQIETHLDPQIQRNNLVVNMHPHASELSQFFIHLDDLGSVVKAWNAHRIRGTRSNRLYLGKPMIMYEAPFVYRLEDQSMTVGENVTQCLEQECIFYNNSCAESIGELCRSLMAENNLPTIISNPYAAVKLYVELRTIIYQLLEQKNYIFYSCELNTSTLDNKINE